MFSIEIISSLHENNMGGGQKKVVMNFLLITQNSVHI